MDARREILARSDQNSFLNQIIQEKIAANDYLEGNYHITIIANVAGTELQFPLSEVLGNSTTKIVVRLEKESSVHMDRRLWRESYLMNVIHKIVPRAHKLLAPTFQADLYELIPGERLDQLSPDGQAIDENHLQQVIELMALLTEISKNSHYKPFKLSDYVSKKNRENIHAITQLAKLLPDNTMLWDLFIEQNTKHGKLEGEVLKKHQEIPEGHDEKSERKLVVGSPDKELYVFQMRILEKLAKLPSIEEIDGEINDLTALILSDQANGYPSYLIDGLEKAKEYHIQVKEHVNVLSRNLAIDLSRILAYDDANSPLSDRIQHLADRSKRVENTTLPLLLPEDYPDDYDTVGFAEWIGDFTQKVFDKHKEEYASLFFGDKHGLGIPEEPLKPFFAVAKKLHPRAFCFLHTDLHRKNIIVENGIVKVIDWEHLLWGDPLFERVRHEKLMNYPDKQKVSYNSQYEDKIAPEFKQYGEEDKYIYEMHEMIKSSIVDTIRTVEQIEKGSFDPKKFAVYVAKLNYARTNYWGHKDTLSEEQVLHNVHAFIERRKRRSEQPNINLEKNKVEHIDQNPPWKLQRESGREYTKIVVRGILNRVRGVIGKDTPNAPVSSKPRPDQADRTDFPL